MAKYGIIRRVASYLADILTFSRFILAGFLLYLLIIGGAPECVLLIFCIGELTDAFDGTCAKKWPFQKGHEPKYRKYAEQYDMIADILLLGFMGLYIVIRVNIWFLLMLVFVILFCTIVELICYGRPFGHPNFCKENSLYKKNKKLAEKILLARRKIMYLPSIAVAIITLILATSWPNYAKIVIFSLAFAIGIFLWFFLETRRKNVARD